MLSLIHKIVIGYALSLYFEPLFCQMSFDDELCQNFGIIVI